LDVWRDGKTVQREVRLRERPDEDQQETTPRKPDAGRGIDWLGIQYQDLSSDLRSAHGIPSGVDGVVVTNVSPTSPLYEQLVRPGQIISAVNGQKVGGVDYFEMFVKAAKAGSYLRLYVNQFAGRGAPAQRFFAVVQAP
jgi:serine protease Do